VVVLLKRSSPNSFFLEYFEPFSAGLLPTPFPPFPAVKQFFADTGDKGEYVRQGLVYESYPFSHQRRNDEVLAPYELLVLIILGVSAGVPPQPLSFSSHSAPHTPPQSRYFPGNQCWERGLRFFPLKSGRQFRFVINFPPPDFCGSSCPLPLLPWSAPDDCPLLLDRRGCVDRPSGARVMGTRPLFSVTQTTRSVFLSLSFLTRNFSPPPTPGNMSVRKWLDP